MRLASRLLFLIAAIAPAACSRPAGLFSEANARAHVSMLAGTIGTRPVGTSANARARAYIVEQLRQFGLEVRVQEADARRRELGLTARVSNVIGVLPGSRGEAIGLLSHYDSSPYAPGAADDALGVAVSLEAARVFAAQSNRTWSLLVMITDGEEAGLMGAAALVTDRQVTDRLQAYINVEAVGSAGLPVLFETGPGNSWLIASWARRAPYPRGGSYGVEIYKRLPNDTDFTILKDRGIPGLNFAAVGDSYAYHTARDTPERLSPRTVRTTGENVATILEALQSTDITRRTGAEPTFFDIGNTVGVAYGPVWGGLLAGAAVIFGLLGWARVLRQAVRFSGVGRWILTAGWTAVGVAITAGAMVGVTWLLRAARESLHPWYAHPGRLFALLLMTGITVAWSMARAGQWLPSRAHGFRHPVTTWSVTLPLWIALAAAAMWFAPNAAYFWTVPLLSAGVLLSLVRTGSARSVRAASIVVLAVCGTLWLRESLEFLQFLVAVMGRLPIVTPAFVYAAIMCLAAVMIAPPLIAASAASRPILRPSVVTALLLIATVVAAAAAYRAPAYTQDRPLRRHVRALQNPDAANATWEVGSVEPGLDLAGHAPSGWAPAAAAVETSIPWGRLTFPFVFRAAGPPLGAPPATITSWSAVKVAGGTEAVVNVVPSEAGVAVAFVLPAGIEPARSNFPGIVRLGQWTATFIAPPPEGIAWRASFTGVEPAALERLEVVGRMPRFALGPGPQGLPDWLPQENAVWSSAASWRLSLPSRTVPPLAPVPPLR